MEIPDGRFVTFPLWMWETIVTRIYLAAGNDELDEWLASVEHSMDSGGVLPEPFKLGSNPAGNGSSIRTGSLVSGTGTVRLQTTTLDWHDSCVKPQQHRWALPRSCEQAT